jgi:hypothetical protein
MLLVENATSPLNVEMSASVMGFRRTITEAAGSTHLKAPTIYIASGDEYPWDTVVVFALWIWCLVQVACGQPARLDSQGQGE